MTIYSYDYTLYTNEAEARTKALERITSKRNRCSGENISEIREKILIQKNGYIRHIFYYTFRSCYIHNKGEIVKEQSSYCIKEIN